MKSSHVIAIAAGLTALAGCANAKPKVLGVTLAGDSVESRTGYAYPLQFSQYDLTLTRRLASCDDEGLPVADIKAEVVAKTVDDGDHVYVIHPDDLIGSTKTADVQLAWEDGRLTSVNATAEDHTGSVISAVVGGIGKLLLTGAVLGVSSDPDAPKCSARAATELQHAKLAQATIKGLDTSMAKARLDLDEVAAKLAKDPKNAAWLKEQAGLLDSLTKQKADLETAQKALKNALDFLTHTQTVSWPDDGKTFKTAAPFVLPIETLKTWVDVPRLASESGQDAVYALRAKGKYEAIDQRFDIYARIERIGTYGVDPEKPGATNDDTGSEAGVRYRLPAQGRLVICQKALCGSNDGDQVVLAQPYPVLQLGRIFYAPFKSPSFANGSMSIAFDKFGRPTTAGVKRTTSQAETAANTFKDVAGQASDVLTQLHNAPLDRLKHELEVVKAQKELDTAREAGATPLDLIKKETDLLEATKKLADARTALNDDDPLKMLNKEIALAKAQADYAAAMKVLEANPTADRAAQTASFQADTALLAAEKAKIEAEIALSEAKAKQAGN